MSPSRSSTDSSKLVSNVEPLIQQEQAGFRHGRSTADQITLLTKDIQDSFLTQKMVRAVFIDLTAAYDTVWHRGLTCKLLRLLPDKHMISMIIELIDNPDFTLSTGNNQGYRVGGKMSDPNSELSKISDTYSRLRLRLLNVNEVWLSAIL